MGEDANKFNPLRFMEPRKHLASFCPFGLVHRICVGQNLVMIEAKIVIAMVVQHFSFELSPTYVHAPMLLVGPFKIIPNTKGPTLEIDESVLRLATDALCCLMAISPKTLLRVSFQTLLRLLRNGL
ncbi:hypothetical protein CMV_029361 [Castanea mollissima]|uniref:Cytochrome P450 n=1 Tax=Castanea mollissima TaxID=60419 RepID=A0A8J4Q6Q3_9ROSI|nr:hypothetical protein CMV_029361 [Castanea mollissima]